MEKVVCYERRSIVLVALTVFFVQVGLLLTPAPVVAEPAPNGVDLWGVDRLHFPDYGACANPVQNPSFEAGFRYWGFPTVGQGIIPLEYSTFYAIDSNEHHSGSYSLRITALGSSRTSDLYNPLPLGTFALPIVPDTNYTLSFWVKGSYGTNWPRITTIIRDKDVPITPNSMKCQFVDANHYVADQNTWYRLTHTFAVPTQTVSNDFICAYFYCDNFNDSMPQGYVWLDDVQLEQGSAPTSFSQAPVTAQLTSSARGNFLEFGQDPSLYLVIKTTDPNASGDVTISVEDFFFNTVFSNNYEFNTDSSGEDTINLDDLSDTIVDGSLRGVFIVTAVFNIDGVGRAYTDYFRFSVMNFLDNTYKNKDLFNLTYVYQLESCGPEFDRFSTRERAIGFGSLTYDFGSFGNNLDLGLDSERMEKLEDYGFNCTGRPVMQLGGSVISETEANNVQHTMTGINSMTTPSDPCLAAFANICRIKAVDRPWNDIWWFCGESSAGCVPLESNHDAFAKFLIATNQGIKSGDPNAKVLIEGGPWELNAESAGWVERYIQDTNRINSSVHFDGAAAHHYRNCPENPDLDSDIAVFLGMLDNNGYGNLPFYINEGGCYPPFNIPEENMSPYVWNSANSWYMGPLSYHSGRAERTSAAFSARNWLVALKYQDRVACMGDFMTPNRYTDFDFTSRFYDKIPNTLGRILGNATYVQDINFAPKCRCYLFTTDDANHYPIAAIWRYDDSIAKEWQESVSTYSFDFGSQNVKFIDLMENDVNCPKDSNERTIVQISSFPLFIKGASGTKDQLCNAITGGMQMPTTYMDDTIHNGSLTSASPGHNWNYEPNVIPVGWSETLSGSCYQASYQFVIISSSYGAAINNTGELVQVAHKYTVSADLGGTADSTAVVQVYATPEPNGMGTPVLLAQVSRANIAGQGYTLYTTMGTAGSPVPSNLEGYYIQVKLLGGSAYYDNIVVTSELAVTVVVDGTIHNGSLTSASPGHNWNYEPNVIPVGWSETLSGSCYQASYQFVIISSSYGAAINNTGELVQVSNKYTVIADLGGTADSTAVVQVYATPEPNGMGTPVLLAQVSRANIAGQGYTLYTTMGTQGSPADANLEGYYIQVKLLGGSAYYDNIVVISETSALGQATSPSPAKSATGVSITPTLSWTAGSGATSHDVYFGTNQTNVTNATHGSGEYKGNQAGTTYAPGTLNNSTTYYWRIDEVGNGGTTKGTTWSFTTIAAVPTFVAAGTAQSGTGNITVAWPTHQTGDIALLFIESCGGEAVNLGTPAGFAAVTNSPQSTGTGTSGTRITVYWCRATSSSMSSPVVTDPGDHVYGRILTFRGVTATGNPWDVTAGGIKATASTTTTFGTVTTTAGNELIVLAASRDNDSAAAAWSGWTNANLSSLTEQLDDGTTQGNGGGIGVTTGIKATAGSVGASTATVTSSVDGHMTIALKP